MPIHRRIIKLLGFTLFLLWFASFFVRVDFGNGQDWSGTVGSGLIRTIKGHWIERGDYSYTGFHSSRLGLHFSLENFWYSWSAIETLPRYLGQCVTPDKRDRFDGYESHFPLWPLTLAPGFIAFVMVVRDRKFYSRCPGCEQTGHRYRAKTCHHCGRALPCREAPVGLWLAVPTAIYATFWIRGLFEDGSPDLSDAYFMPIVFFAYAWLFHEASRFRARKIREGMCRVCGYDLRENTSGLCPECGAIVPPEIPKANRRAGVLSNRSVRVGLLTIGVVGVLSLFQATLVDWRYDKDHDGLNQLSAWFRSIWIMRKWAWVITVGCFIVAAWCLTAVYWKAKSNPTTDAQNSRPTSSPAE